eukprot:EG_transcript_6943
MPRNAFSSWAALRWPLCKTHSFSVQAQLRQWISQRGMRQGPWARPLTTSTHLPPAGPGEVQMSAGSVPALGNADNEFEGCFRRVYQPPSRVDFDTRRATFDAAVTLLTAALPDRSLRVMAIGYTVTTLLRASNNVLQLSLVEDPLIESSSDDIKKAVQSLKLVPELKAHTSKWTGPNPYFVMLKTLPNSHFGCSVGFDADGVLESHWMRHYVMHCEFARPLMQTVNRWKMAWATTDLGLIFGGARLTHTLHLMVLYFLLHEGLVAYQPPLRVDFATLPAFPDFLPFEKPVPWLDAFQLLVRFFRFYAQWPAGRALVFSEPPTTVVTCEAKGWPAKEFAVEMPYRPSLDIANFLTPKRWHLLQTLFAAAAATQDPQLLFRSPPPKTPALSSVVPSAFLAL